ncbi:hypothetical protein [Actinotalea fermentans]|uniref:Uncharacterized protein n=1 Tax=Actinotalea fermentans TaxID=43671 RepID=A0A511YXC2_9CELL|nr:hypothetical protein [Actinotalea fermentans]KGM16143.1 hypothetical protein N867_02710 [Actinotalea fermentans ATCC 43279 = JCM 9966 = DSM 3133]GEN79786.1 hypothetical protein AFE02nite_15200 [Actinotalea fermentans]
MFERAKTRGAHSSAVGQSFVDGLHLALITAAVVLVAGALVVWRRMRPDEGPREAGAAAEATRAPAPVSA